MSPAGRSRRTEKVRPRAPAVDQHIGQPEIRHRNAENRERGGGGVERASVPQGRYRAGDEGDRNRHRQGVEADEHRIGQARADQRGDRHSAGDRHRGAEIPDHRARQPAPELHDQRRIQSPALVKRRDRLGRRHVTEGGEGRIAVAGAHDEEHRRRAEQSEQDHPAETARCTCETGRRHRSAKLDLTELIGEVE